MAKKRDKATREGLKEIRRELRKHGQPASEEDAIRFAVRVVSTFEAAMLSYGAHCVSQATGRHHAPVMTADGTVGLQDFGEIPTIMQ